MEDKENSLEAIIASLDDYSVAISKEAEKILQAGYLSIEEFMTNVKTAAEQAGKPESFVNFGTHTKD